MIFKLLLILLLAKLEQQKYIHEWGFLLAD